MASWLNTPDPKGERKVQRTSTPLLIDVSVWWQTTGGLIWNPAEEVFGKTPREFITKWRARESVGELNAWFRDILFATKAKVQTGCKLYGVARWGEEDDFFDKVSNTWRFKPALRLDVYQQAEDMELVVARPGRDNADEIIAHLGWVREYDEGDVKLPSHKHKKLAKLAEKKRKQDAKQDAKQDSKHQGNLNGNVNDKSESKTKTTEVSKEPRDAPHQHPLLINVTVDNSHSLIWNPAADVFGKTPKEFIAKWNDLETVGELNAWFRDILFATKIKIQTRCKFYGVARWGDDDLFDENDNYRFQSMLSLDVYGHSEDMKLGVANAGFEDAYETNVHAGYESDGDDHTPLFHRHKKLLKLAEKKGKQKVA